MTSTDLTFNDLCVEIKFEIFKYLDLSDRIRCRYVSREWWSVLTEVLKLQETVVIGQQVIDSTDRLKLSLCNIHPGHNNGTPFNTITNDLLNEFMTNCLGYCTETNENGGEKRVSQLLKTFERLRVLFIYAPAVPIKLGDITDTVEHIHFGHNATDFITFDKINFAKLTCISTIDAHLDDRYMNAIIRLLQAHKLQLENVSVCEVPRLLCEQIIEMQHLKQLYVFDFDSVFEEVYKEKKLEIMDAHPVLQFFNLFNLFDYEQTELVCPTEKICRLVEFGSTQPLDRQFLIDVFDQARWRNVIQFLNNITYGLHKVFPGNFQLSNDTPLINLRHLRLSYYFLFTKSILKKTLGRYLKTSTNLRTIHVRIFAPGSFAKEGRIKVLFSLISAYAQKHSNNSIRFELSVMGEKCPEIDPNFPCFPKNLDMVMQSLRPLNDS